MGQIKDKGEDTQQGDIYALHYQQRIPGNPVWVGEKVGQTETKSVKELEGNVIFGEESLKTGGKDFHGSGSFRRGWGGSFDGFRLSHPFECINELDQQDPYASRDRQNGRILKNQPVCAGKGQEK